MDDGNNFKALMELIGKAIDAKPPANTGSPSASTSAGSNPTEQGGQAAAVMQRPAAAGMNAPTGGPGAAVTQPQANPRVIALMQALRARQMASQAQPQQHAPLQQLLAQRAPMAPTEPDQPAPSRKKPTPQPSLPHKPIPQRARPGTGGW